MDYSSCYSVDLSAVCSRPSERSLCKKIKNNQEQERLVTGGSCWYVHCLSVVWE